MLAAFFTFFVDAAAEVAGERLGPVAARTLAIELEDAEQSFDEELVDLVAAESPGRARAPRSAAPGALVPTARCR